VAMISNIYSSTDCTRSEQKTWCCSPCARKEAFGLFNYVDSCLTGERNQTSAPRRWHLGGAWTASSTSLITMRETDSSRANHQRWWSGVPRVGGYDCRGGKIVEASGLRALSNTSVRCDRYFQLNSRFHAGRCSLCIDGAHDVALT
jgi:hypothetical protein